MGLSKEMLGELRNYEQGNVPEEEWRKKDVNDIVEMLGKAGFDTSDEPNKSNRGTKSRFYYKEGVDLVFCTIDTEKSKGARNKGIYYTIIDKITFDKFKDFEPKFNISQSGDYVTLYLKHIPGDWGTYRGTLLHSVLKSDEVSKETPVVDHVTNNGFININQKDYLRVCNPLQNKMNSRYTKLVNVQEDTLSFYIIPQKSIKGKEEKLRELGLVKKGKNYYSIMFDSEEELYKTIGAVEKAIYGEFRYDPLKDFSQTWYVLVYEKMLGKISHEEAKEYQRDYFKRTHPDIAKYCGLLWE